MASGITESACQNKLNMNSHCLVCLRFLELRGHIHTYISDIRYVDNAIVGRQMNYRTMNEGEKFKMAKLSHETCK